MIDRPAIPKLRTGRVALAWGAISVVLVVIYALAGLRGWDFADTEHDTIPVSVRTSPGGYRSFHFWHSGYQGGK